MTGLEERRRELTGRYLTQAEANYLALRLPVPVGWLLDLMGHCPLIGTKFTLAREQDLSGLGVEFTWMTPEDIVGETLEFYPGIAAVQLGYVAIGTCLFGSGDPYFVRASEDDPPLVRIPHDRLKADLSLSESVVEVVRPRLSDFFLNSRIG